MYLLSCQPRTVFKKGKIEIDYIEKFNCLHLTWGGHISSQVYMSTMSELLAISRKYKVEFWVLDAREGDSFELMDLAWATQFFTQEIPELAVKKIARIAGYDFNFETKLSGFISRIVKNKNVNYRFKYQPDTDHAISWFLETDGQEKI